MTETISLTLREAINAEHTGIVPIILCTVMHPSLSGPKRFSTDPTERLSDDPLTYGTMSRGEAYAFLPVDYLLPGEGESATQTIDVALQVVDAQLRALFRTFTTPATIDLELVDSGSPDTVSRAWRGFTLAQADLGLDSIVLSLAVDDKTREPYPADLLSPGVAPVMF